MIFLRTLGPIDLHGSGGEDLRAVIAQPKRLALLCYLALAKGSYVRRESVISVFWPESDEERGRASFRQAIRFLRQSLGSGVIENRGSDEIAIADGSMWCDALAFQEALKNEDFTGALDLYKGHLLEGMNVSDAPEFERWADEWREHFRREAAMAASRLSARREREMDLSGAIESVRHGLAISRLDESLMRRLLFLLDQQGERALAVSTYDSFAHRLALELDVDPSPETRALIDVIRSRAASESAADVPPKAPPISLAVPGREVLAVHSLPSALGPFPLRGGALQSQPAHASRVEPSSPGRSSVQRRLLVPALALIIIILAAVVWLVDPTPGPHSIQPVMVVPFDNRTGEASLDVLGGMAADWITQGIARTGAFEVVPATAVMSAQRFVSDEGVSDGGINALRLVIRETGAASVVRGAFYVQGDSMYLHASVIRVRDSRILAEIRPVSVAAGDALEGVQEVQRRVLAALAPLSDAPSHARAAATPPTFESYASYLAGMEAFVRGDVNTAIQHFTRSAQADSAYLLPVLSLAIMHMNLGDFSIADSIASALHPRREALGALENLTLTAVQGWLRGDDASVYEAMKRHRRIAPGTIGHYQLAEQARRLNRPAEAIRVLQELGPERGELRGWVYYWRELTASRNMLGQHRRELTAARRARALYPDHASVLFYEARAHAALGRTRDLERLASERAALSSDDPVGAGQFFTSIANELRANGHHADAKRFDDRAIAWWRGRWEAERSEYAFKRGEAFSFFSAGLYSEAERSYHHLLDIDSTAAPVIGYAGILAARRGDTITSRSMLERLERIQPRYDTHRPTYWQAIIEAHLGNEERAIALLKESFAKGLQYGPWMRSEPALEPFRQYPAFRQLIAPKG
jgi:DNA-binding SARP family transcriptional activator/tetratricopeptide (TPR) repeat protein